MPYTATLQLKAKAQPNIKVKAQGLGEMISVRVSLGSTTFLNRGSLSFSPLSLFTLGSQGAWYDPTDVANLEWRRNLLLRTQEFDNAAWGKFNSPITANAANAPDGTLTADLVQAAAGASALFQTAALSTGTSYTFSVWARGAVGGEQFRFSFKDTIEVSPYQTLTTEWQRYSWTGTTAFASDTRAIRDFTSGSQIYIWGAQLELGTSATDYQPITNLNNEVIALFPDATMYQDTAGTVPVTTSGNTVGLLLDKSEGLVLGPELVVNGDFSGGTTGWTDASSAPATAIIAGEVATLDSLSGGTARLRSTARAVTTAGKAYKIEYSYSGSGTVNLAVGTTSGGFDLLNAGTSRSGVFFATGTTIYISFSSVGGVLATIDNISVRELAGNHATQPTLAARPIYRVAANGDKVLENDGIDDALNVTLPNLGTNCTVCYVTQSEVRLDEAVTLNGSYTLPNVDILGFVAIDRALTKLEKIQLIYYMASKAQGVTYGAGIDDLDLIAMNAVDLFVYDTSKDSDGGAWRTGALAQASSWFNETLNTATRGSRREFPAVAVIVAESNKVTIYDGDDPDLPMWMVFTGGSNNLLRNITITSVFALCGMLVVGSTTGLSSVTMNEISFLSDRSVDRSSGTAYLYNGTIAQRNAGLSTTATSAAGAIVNSNINDVAMTVLPGAPIDPATGLPVPTIAVATAGGVSVITDSGAVYDIPTTGSTSNLVEFLPNSRLSLQIGAAINFGDIPTSDQTNETTWRDYFLHPSASTPASLQGFTSGASIVHPGYAGTSGLTLLAEQPTTPAKGMVAYTTPTYNTGWMPGAIKGAFLSDTSATALVGSGELVTNGDFATNDLTGFTDLSIGTGTVDASSGAAVITATDASNRGKFSYTGSGFIIGSKYRISFDASATTYVVASGVSGFQNTNYSSNVDVDVIATSTTVTLSFERSGSSGTTTIDNISVKLADADRSVNNKGLVVNGTVTRTAVATGANLVAYSGFSAANYLSQPYNSGLDFGTGDFSVMGWVKQLPNSSSEFVLSRGSASGYFAFYTSTAGFPSFRINDGTSHDVIGGNVIDDSTWHFAVGVRRGGTMYLYIDAVSVGTPVASTKTVTDPDAVLKIGEGVSISAPLTNGSLALWRISATAPTAEQITKIYNDELPLFQVNAQATLYGASDAVTALAHDPDTDLLHVGTSSGRSVFRGLERISHRAKSITTSISAVGGLVIDK